MIKMINKSHYHYFAPQIHRKTLENVPKKYLFGAKLWFKCLQFVSFLGNMNNMWKLQSDDIKYKFRVLAGLADFAGEILMLGKCFRKYWKLWQIDWKVVFLFVKQLGVFSKFVED